MECFTSSTNIECSKVNNDCLDVMGEPNVCIVAVSSSYFSIYLLADMLKEKGWSLNQLQNPPAFHF